MFVFTKTIPLTSKGANSSFLVLSRPSTIWRPAPRPRFTHVHTFIASATDARQKRRMPAVMRAVVPAPELLQFTVEDRAQPRSEILRSMMKYVKAKNLQDPDNKRIIHCDKNLKSVLGVEQCTFIEINRYLSPHVRKPEDIGGRYIEEAKQAEISYLEKRRLEEETEKQEKEDSSTSKRSPKARTFKPVILSEELATICRAKELTRPEILKAIWGYIRLNNLKEDSRGPVRCDFLLKKVFHADKVDARTILKGISAHVTKKK